jgi:aminoglycoside phosphotransferase (APT) family kinase protein
VIAAPGAGPGPAREGRGEAVAWPPPRILSPGRLLAGLVAHGLVETGDALEGRVVLTDLSRSNPVSAVAIGGTDRFVVKQRGIRVDDVDPMAAEVAAYAWLTDVGLGGIAPSAHVAGDGWLVLEAVAGAASLHDLVLRRDPQVAPAFAALGAAMGLLHATRVEPAVPVSGSAVASAGSLEPRRPWLLDLEARGLPAVVPASAVVTAVRDRLLARPAVASLLRELAAGWSVVAVIHGDIKFDNVLVGPAEGSVGAGDGSVGAGDGSGPRVWLIDWELAGLGEPAWDLAGIVEGVVTAQAMTTGRVDIPSAAALVGPGLEAYAGAGGGPVRGTLIGWTAARLAQASLQLAAMAAENADDARRADDIADLAISFVEESRAWAPLLGRPGSAA